VHDVEPGRVERKIARAKAADASTYSGREMARLRVARGNEQDRDRDVADPADDDPAVDLSSLHQPTSQSPADLHACERAARPYLHPR
jgi:hypothetical protein